MNLGIFGSRTFTNYPLFCSILSQVLAKQVVVGPSIIVSGGAKGVDSLARQWAIDNGRGILEFFPQWEKNGKAAGMIRNRQIRQWSTHGIAIWDGESKGTKDMIDNWPGVKPLRVFDFAGNIIRIGKKNVEKG